MPAAVMFPLSCCSISRSAGGHRTGSGAPEPIAGVGFFVSYSNGSYQGRFGLYRSGRCALDRFVRGACKGLPVRGGGALKGASSSRTSKLTSVARRLI